MAPFLSPIRDRGSIGGNHGSISQTPGIKKKPSTSELLDWLKLILHEDMPLEILQDRDPTKAIPPLHGALLKNEQDVHLFERLVFMTRAKA